jgi:hypothetical protein
MKAKAVVDWQFEKHMCDFFIYIIRELYGNDSISQTIIDFNIPLHSNWVGLLEPTNQLVISKQPIQLTSQMTLLKKTLEEILKDINIHVLETKYVINLGQLLRIVSHIKRYILKSVKYV